MTETDNPIDRQTMIYKVSWQTGFLLQVVNESRLSQILFVVKSQLSRHNCVCYLWTASTQVHDSLCLFSLCKWDGMTEYVGYTALSFGRQVVAKD